MKTAKELYPEYLEMEQKDGYFYGPCDYQPILKSIGTILIQVDEGDYQGDSMVLYKKGSKYGYLIFGWGSCSGCDALQACENMEEIQSLIDQLHNDVKWFDSLNDLKAYFINKDWELEYLYHSDGGKEFIEKVINYQI